MQVSWFEQTGAEVPAADDWLSPAERARLDGLRLPKRRQDWRLGRWTAKHAVTAYLKLPSGRSNLAAIEIRPAPSGAPEVFLKARPAPLVISLTHRDGRAACVVADARVTLGCDLEVVEPRSDTFVWDYFTTAEQQIVSRAAPSERFRIVALLWSAKESALKALRTGLRMDVRSVVVSVDDNPFPRIDLPPPEGVAQFATPGWRRLTTRHPEGAFHGWWQCRGDLVRTMVSAPESAAPLALHSQESMRSEILWHQPGATKPQTADAAALWPAHR